MWVIEVFRRFRLQLKGKVLGSAYSTRLIILALWPGYDAEHPMNSGSGLQDFRVPTLRALDLVLGLRNWS